MKVGVQGECCWSTYIFFRQTGISAGQNTTLIECTFGSKEGSTHCWLATEYCKRKKCSAETRRRGMQNALLRETGNRVQAMEPCFSNGASRLREKCITIRLKCGVARNLLECTFSSEKSGSWLQSTPRKETSAKSSAETKRGAMSHMQSVQRNVKGVG